MFGSGSGITKSDFPPRVFGYSTTSLNSGTLHCDPSECFSHYIRIQGGDCHPNYVFCGETQTCNPLLYSACGYSDWLKNLMLEKCIQQSPRHLIKQCVDDYRLK